MSECNNIEFLETDNIVDVVELFAKDVERGLTSAAMITTKDLAGYALDCIGIYAPIRMVDFADSDNNIFVVLYDNYTYEVKAIPYGTLTQADKKHFEKIYVDGDCDIKQSEIDLYSADGCDVVLFVENDDANNGICSCKKSPHCDSCQSISQGKYDSSLTDTAPDTHGFSVSKNTDNGYISYTYYSTEDLSPDTVKDLLSHWGI